MGARTAGGAQPGARLRSSSDGSRYSGRSRRQRADSSSSSVTSTVLSNPKSGENKRLLKEQNGCSTFRSQRSLLKQPVSTEELQRPGGRFVWKSFTVVGDAVGWGFVVRGNGPCHIQAVEPSGPAAAAGLKVRQFLLSVNGLNVLGLDYRSVSHLILTGPRTVVMEVMEETQH